MPVLIKAKASLDIQNNQGYIALAIAAAHGHTAIVTALIKAKAALEIHSKRATQHWSSLHAEATAPP